MTKNEILAEIRRTAAANGGKPLGVDRFESETGIRRYAWLGKFWSRWSEAVGEAGFVGNVRQGRVLEDDDLLRLVALAARELGRLPTTPELMLRRKGDTSFPSHTVFQRRIGVRQGAIAARLLDFCKRHSGFDDVARICEGYDTVVGTARSAKAAAADGFVYMVRSGRRYKIGKSNAFGRRERELAIQLPEAPDTVHVIKTDDPAGIEAYWHARFASKRKGGEWFGLDADDVAAFKRRKFM